MKKEDDINFRDFFIPFTNPKAIVILVITGFLVYFNSLFNGFVWDDFPFILQNPELRSINIFSAFGINYFNNSGYFRPIPALYFSTLFSLFGETAFFYHFIQIALHIACSIFLFFLFKKFFKNEISFLLSAMFLIHPINVESVAYIAASQSELLFLPGIIAFFVLLRKKLTNKNILLIGFLTLVSIFTKETGIFFLLTIFVYIFIFEKKEIFNFLKIFGSVLIIYSTVRFLFGKVFFGTIGHVPISQAGLFERLQNIPAIIFYYLKTFFFPARLAIDQQWIIGSPGFANFYLPLIFDLIFFGSLLWLGFYLLKHRKEQFKIFIFFSFWFVSSLCLLLQIFPLDMTVADRWFYFPIVGLLGIIGIIIENIKFANKKTIYILVLIFILFFGVRTIVRNNNWRDLITLYSHDTPIEDNYDNENNFGIVLVQTGNTKEGLRHFLRANSLKATEFTLRNTGMTYLTLGEKEKAIEYLSRSMEVKSFVLPPHKHQTISYEALARYYIIDGDYKSAVKVLNDGINDYSDAYTLWYLRSVSEYFLNNKSQALIDAKKSYDLYPSPETAILYQTLKNNQPLNMKIGNN